MFVVERFTDPTSSDLQKRVIDVGRETWIQRVGSQASEPGLAFQMHVGPEALTFDTLPFAEHLDGERIHVDRLEQFGSSPKGELKTGISSYEFKDLGTREQWILLAAEALLVFGENYNGLRLPLRYHFVEITLDGATKRMSKTDFPYMSAIL